MSAVLEQVKPKVYDSVDYFDHRTVGANVVRWVFNPLDLIDPQRKAEIEWLAVGGEETSCPCLQRYGRGFMPRGLASILELGGEPIPMRHLGDLQSVAWAGFPLNDHAVANKFGFVPVYPGDGLKILRRYALNDGGMRKGIDEIEALRGKEWAECHNPEGTGILDVLEQAMFGDGMEKTLAGLENQIKHAKVSDNRIDVGKYKSEALNMCNDARNWATRKISWEHSLLKVGSVAIGNDAVGATGGWAYGYSPIGELLLTQLDIPRQDQPLQEMAKMFGNQQSQPQGLSAADMDLVERRMMEQMESRLTLAREADAKRIAELEAKLGETNETEVKMYTCEHCNEEMKLTAKGFHIGRHCKVLHPIETTE